MAGRRPKISVVDAIPPKPRATPERKRKATPVEALGKEVLEALDGQPESAVVQVTNQPVAYAHGLRKFLGPGYRLTTRNMRPLPGDDKRRQADFYVARAPAQDVYS
jgi:hypothetical protein